MGIFAGTFAPIVDESEGLKLAEDILSLGFAMLASAMWNKALEAVPYFKENPNLFGTGKDWVNHAVSNAITIAKDTSTIAGAELSATNDLDENMVNLVKIWDSTFDDFTQNLFNGSDPSNAMLHNMITGGKVLEPGFPIDEGSVLQVIEKSIYGFLIPQAWPLRNLNLRRVIIDAKSPCGTVNPIDQYIADDDGNANYVCYHGSIYGTMSGTEITVIVVMVSVTKQCIEHTLSLLLSCRQVHVESRLVPYSNHVFHILDHDAMGLWIKKLSLAKIAARRNIRLGHRFTDLRAWEGSLEFLGGRLRGVRNIELQLSKAIECLVELATPGLERPLDFQRIKRLNLGAATLTI